MVLSIESFSWKLILIVNTTTILLYLLINIGSINPVHLICNENQYVQGNTSCLKTKTFAVITINLKQVEWAWKKTT